MKLLILLLLTPCIAFSQACKIRSDDGIFIKGSKWEWECERKTLDSLLGRPDSVHLHQYPWGYDSTVCYRDANFHYAYYEHCYLLYSLRFSDRRKDFSATFADYKVSYLTTPEEIMANSISYEYPAELISGPDELDKKPGMRYVEVYDSRFADGNTNVSWTFCFRKDKLVFVFIAYNDL